MTEKYSLRTIAHDLYLLGDKVHADELLDEASKAEGLLETLRDCMAYAIRLGGDQDTSQTLQRCRAAIDKATTDE